mmetsp:Transcript_13526/g.18528  ORF Transcript_13526/g.18528 Transcript_13526/m.18528 type:complete len:141 (+) Transcript_13526:39-461(+)
MHANDRQLIHSAFSFPCSLYVCPPLSLLLFSSASLFLSKRYVFKKLSQLLSTNPVLPLAFSDPIVDAHITDRLTAAIIGCLVSRNYRRRRMTRRRCRMVEVKAKVRPERFCLISITPGAKARIVVVCNTHSNLTPCATVV